MNRTELDQLDRDALIARAEAAGVARPRILTRPELVDELLLRSAVDKATVQRHRGLFGRARDLLARVVERGLHLPDAADRIRAIRGFALPPSVPSAPSALPTVTLAEIYSAQGHRDRAVETLQGVLAREPEHAAARALLAQLRDAAYAVPAPRMPPEPDEESTLAAPDVEISDSVADTSAHQDGESVDFEAIEGATDECVAVPIDPTTLFAYWRTAGVDRSAPLVLRAVVIEPRWEGPRSSVRDHAPVDPSGGMLLKGLPARAVVRVAIGTMAEDAFAPLAHSPSLMARGAFSHLFGESLARWTPSGTVALSAADQDAASIRRALTYMTSNGYAPST
jgi:hypothetical protein